MDKLQPVLKHKFWILASIALLLPVIGWYMANSAVSQEIQARKDSIKQSKDQIPGGSVQVNPEISQELQVLVDERKKWLKQARMTVWNNQRKLMFWPSEVANLMQEVPYRGELNDHVAREIYATRYHSSFEDDVIGILDPFNPETNRGRIIVNRQRITHVPENEWDILTPGWKEMWDAQEDLWLLTDLFQSIAEINRGPNLTILDTPIRELKELQLIGGNRDALGAGTGGMGEGMGGAAGGEGAVPFDDPGMGMDPFSGRIQGGGSGDLRVGKPTFDPSQEFGPATSTISGDNPDDAPPGTDGPLMGAKRTVERYVDKGDELEFRTRGFYMHLVMDHRQLPELLVQLTKSNWPVEIVRVNQTSLHPTVIMGDSDLSNPMAGGAGADPFGPAGPDGAPPDINLDDFGQDGGGFPDAGGNRRRSGGSSTLAKAALADPYMAEVVIAGLMTLYKPPEGLTEAQTEKTAEGDPAENPQQNPSEGVQSTPTSTTDTGITTPEQSEPELPAIPDEFRPDGNTTSLDSPPVPEKEPRDRTETPNNNPKAE